MSMMLAASLCTAAAASVTVADYFRMYYAQQVAAGTYDGPLDFLRNEAAAHTDAARLLEPDKARAVVIDRAHGYLRIDDSSDTDETLTMGVYRKAEGAILLVVASSDCADACNFAVQFFGISGDKLQPVPPSSVIPAIKPEEFIRPGHSVPKALVAAAPAINYLPARIGTTLTLKPWYGYETEEQMDRTTRAAIRDVVLNWDGKQGRFVRR